MENIPIKSYERALISLEGLSVGDAFGEQFFIDEKAAISAIKERAAPNPPEGYVWAYTDDTNMALSIVSSLKRFEKIDQDWLAQSFADHYDHERGYGIGMYRLLKEIKRGKHWTKEAKRLFYNEGSYGNGAAMRVAPLGAYFANDLNLTMQQAAQSAEVTHAHPEGIAGAVAVALAAALAWQWAVTKRAPDPTEFLSLVLNLLPESEVKLGLHLALQLPAGTSVEEAVSALGNGTEITAQDTVPFALWCAAHHLDNYEEALWQTVSGLGDRDTTCAIVGGIVACYTGLDRIPQQWRTNREPLPDWPFAE